MNILVACEESQTVTKELRILGHNAYSCDIDFCSGGRVEWHIQQDVIPLLNGNCVFKTCDGNTHTIYGKWDMILAFPPCTYLTNAGNRHYSLKMNSLERVRKRLIERAKAIEFFLEFVNADCKKIAIENPVGIMNTIYKKPSQIIHPYYFAKSENDIENYVQKKTCLWLKGIPELEYYNVLPRPQHLYICQGEKCKGKKIGWCEGIRNIPGGKKGRTKARSKTFIGVAQAMAEQWTKI